MSDSVRLIPAREKIFAQGHPWVFSGALVNPAGLPDGATVDLLTTGGDWLARGGRFAHWRKLCTTSVLNVYQLCSAVEEVALSVSALDIVQSIIVAA